MPRTIKNNPDIVPKIENKALPTNVRTIKILLLLKTKNEILYSYLNLELNSM